MAAAVRRSSGPTPLKEVQVDSKIKMRVPENLTFIKKVGSGAYGCVASFKDEKTGEKVAVKKITNAFHDLIDGKRILREVRLLRTFKHDNLSQILDMYPPEDPEFDDIYIVMDLMETDLHKVISSKQVLNEEHCQYFAYQILRGLLYLHSANVVHRDLKPQNILVNKNCDLKICDFGLARGLAPEEDDAQNLTDYVVTRWYRAPEVVLLASEYTKSIDVWAVGCILAELIGRRPLFTGKDHLDQIKKVCQVIGSPTEADLDWLPRRSPARGFLAKIPKCSKQPWAALYSKASKDAHEALEAMLTFHPERRVDVNGAIRMTFFTHLHMPHDEPTADGPVDWSFDNFKPTKKLLQNYIYVECWKFHPWLAERDGRKLRDRGIELK